MRVTFATFYGTVFSSIRTHRPANSSPNWTSFVKSFLRYPSNQGKPFSVVFLKLWRWLNLLSQREAWFPNFREWSNFSSLRKDFPFDKKYHVVLWFSFAKNVPHASFSIARVWMTTTCFNALYPSWLGGNIIGRIIPSAHRYEGFAFTPSAENFSWRQNRTILAKWKWKQSIYNSRKSAHAAQDALIPMEFKVRSCHSWPKSKTRKSRHLQLKSKSFSAKETIFFSQNETLFLIRAFN